MHGPVALPTKLGYVLSGPVGTSPPYPEDSTVNLTETHVLEICTAEIDEKLALDQQVKQSWDLETLGIKENEPTVYEKFLVDVKHDEERYQVKLPFKECHTTLPDNYQLSKSRLMSFLRRLKSRPDILKHNDGIIQEPLERNITKIRIVYDASSKRTGPSLNDSSLRC